MSVSNGRPDREANADEAAPMRALLAGVDEIVRDTQVRERFGDVGPAFAAVLGSWVEPFAAAMREVGPTTHSQAAARAMTDLARLTGAFAGQAARSVAGLQAIGTGLGLELGLSPDPGSGPSSGPGLGADLDPDLGLEPSSDPDSGLGLGPDPSLGSDSGPDSGSGLDLEPSSDPDPGLGLGPNPSLDPNPDPNPGEHYASLARRIDDAFLEFSSSPEFDRARRRAAAAVLDWLEHDPDAASSIARALDPPPSFMPTPFDDPMPAAGAEAIRLDGNATLRSYPGAGKTSASVLVVPGFTMAPRVFDLDPQRSTVRTLAKHGVDTWLLDWGVSGEADRMRTVANQLERIDRAVDAVRAAAASGRPLALAGHFHGGLLALLYCIRHPDKVAALVTLSTPVEFASSDDAFAGWLRACDGERLVDVFGNIPGPLVAALVAAVSPMHWCGGGFLALLGSLESAGGGARIARFEQARRIPPAFPGETFRGLYRAFYRDNAFAAHGGAVIDGCRYELSNLETPLLNIYARDDSIVPPRASIPLAEWSGAASGSSREQRGGHFDLLDSRDSHQELLPGIAAWLIERTRDS